MKSVKIISALHQRAFIGKWVPGYRQSWELDTNKKSVKAIDEHKPISFSNPNRIRLSTKYKIVVI